MEQNNDDARVLERALVFLDVAKDLQDGNVLPQGRIRFFPGRIHLFSKSYFVLNDAYKRWRIKPGHFTKDPKKAALQCMCIMEIEPFVLVDQTDATTVAEVHPNGIYALSCASVALGLDVMSLKGDNHDLWLRLLDILSRTRCETIRPVIEDANAGVEMQSFDYKLPIHESDQQTIDMLVTIFEFIDRFDEVG